MSCENIYCNQGRNCTCKLNQENSDGSNPDLPVTMYDATNWIQSLAIAIMLCATAGAIGIVIGAVLWGMK